MPEIKQEVVEVEGRKTLHVSLPLWMLEELLRQIDVKNPDEIKNIVVTNRR